MEQYIHTFDSYTPANTERYVPTSRMQVMSSVYLPASDIDFQTGSLRPDRQRRCRTQAIRLEKDKLDKEEARLLESVMRENSKGGVRISSRLLILTIAAVLFFCGIYLLTQQGIIVDRQKAVNRLERSISDYRTQNEELKAQIAEASDAATVCYAASQELNMIPAESAEAIHLVAVDTRPLSREQTGTVQSTLAASAQNDQLTAESTKVPTLASVAN